MEPIKSSEFLKLGKRDFDNGAVREAIYKAIKNGEATAEDLAAEKVHSATSDFCSLEWKKDCDELKSLLVRALTIIETVSPGSSEEKEEQFLWVEDAKTALGGGRGGEG